MKNIIIALLLSLTLRAQGQPCGTFEPPNDLVILPSLQAPGEETIYRIPVIFHILFSTAADSVYMSDARIQTEVDVINEDFRARNADATQTVIPFKALVADCKIEFCLKRITRTRTAITSFADFASMKRFSTGGADVIDPINILNIWVLHHSGVGGFAVFPTAGMVGSWQDGVVCNWNTIGRDDRRSGGVTTHEIGHYLYLYHTFGGLTNCIGNGDYCPDTPPTDAPAGSCNLTRQACGGLTMNQNYMEYTDCMTLFTPDQKVRMRATLEGIRSGLVTNGLCTGTTPDNPPVVTVTSPTPNQTFTAPASITINATATDDKGVTKVEFYNSATLLNTDLTAPYSYVWTGVTAGTYTINAKAYDATQSRTASVQAFVNSSNNTPPVVSITSPVSGETFAAPATFRVMATASDNGFVKKVEFYVGTTLISTDSLTPYNVMIGGAGVGTYLLKAKAYDNLNLSATSATVTVTVTATVVGSPAKTITLMPNGSLEIVANDGRKKTIP